MHFPHFPRLHFTHLPTPLEPMIQLSVELGGPNLWIKRDYCTGLTGADNKTRKLEFLMADAQEQGAVPSSSKGPLSQTTRARQWPYR